MKDRRRFVMVAAAVAAVLGLTLLVCSPRPLPHPLMNVPPPDSSTAPSTTVVPDATTAPVDIAPTTSATRPTVTTQTTRPAARPSPTHPATTNATFEPHRRSTSTPPTTAP